MGPGRRRRTTANRAYDPSSLTLIDVDLSTLIGMLTSPIPIPTFDVADTGDDRRRNTSGTARSTVNARASSPVELRTVQVVS